ncbi:D-sedoheptulose-7-phosphate isomerase [Portibacter lacus]|uniref:Phosphoheptose isomerase n=1 Tax=Portibacter lacus TaxID=1099794 RepID=A0AA37SSN3_9BACT|nr:SIS domain-containing protein [Portibacter lacus]GLR18829.1 phosphoheptose isomerase [Portibacter lacus]
MLDQIKERIFENSLLSSGLLSDEGFCNNLLDIALHAVETLKAGNRIFFAGNGGSTSQAQHLAAELSGRFLLDRDPLDAICLSDNISFLTAVSNDYSYEVAFERALQAHGKRGDLLFLLSTSGSSPNIVKLSAKAKEIGVSRVLMTGLKGTILASECEQHITIPSVDTARIQEMHILCGHIICEIIEKEMFVN